MPPKMPKRFVELPGEAILVDLKAKDSSEGGVVGMAGKFLPIVEGTLTRIEKTMVWRAVEPCFDVELHLRGVTVSKEASGIFSELLASGKLRAIVFVQVD